MYFLYHFNFTSVVHVYYKGTCLLTLNHFYYRMSYSTFCHQCCSGY